LRLRNFTIGRSLTEDELLGPGGLERVSELLGSLKPFVSLPIENTTFEFPTPKSWCTMGLCQSQILAPGAGNNWGSRDLRRAVCLLLRRQGEPAACLTLVTFDYCRV
jgi:hypothetical protein